MPLRENKKELKTVLDNISDGILFIDNEGTIKLYNMTLAKMFSFGEDLTGEKIYLLPLQDPLRQGIFRSESGFAGPYCWERNKCPGDKNCPGKNSNFCRCWLFRTCGVVGSKYKSCIECPQYQSVKKFLERPKELEIGDKTISVVSSFVEKGKKKEILEVIVFKDVTYEKIDAVVKLAGATAHELRQPLQIIISTAELIRNKLPGDTGAKEHFGAIIESCLRMNSIIERINHLTRYKTKHYLRNEMILDLEESSDGSKKNIM